MPELAPWRDPGALETLSRARRLIDPQSGIVHLLYESAPDPDTPQIFGFGSILADTTKYGVADFGLVNGSTSLVRESAAAGALGEAVERYACRIVPYGDLVWRSLSTIDGLAVDPRELVLYSEEQYARPGFPYRKFDISEPIPWVTGYSLTRDRECLVPAEFVFMSTLEQGRRPLVQQTTNGLACGPTYEAALLSALYEVVERDGLMQSWLGERPGRRLDPAQATSPGLVACLDRFMQVGWPLTLVDITTDVGIPCVLARTQLGPTFANPPIFSSSADRDREKAAQGAIEELAQCLPWVAALTDRGVSPKPPSELATTEDHVLWLAGAGQRHHADFLTSGPDEICEWGHREHECLDTRAALASCVAQLERQGLETVAVELTPPDVQEVGLHVVRVLVPGALPLYFGSGMWRLPLRAGGVATSRVADDASVGFNRLPHPFP